MTAMGTFSASLRAIGDVKSVPATVELDEGRLSIASGSVEIGTWSLDDIHLEPIPTGYRLAAEGDQILIELKDIDSFSEALNSGKRRKLKMPALKRTQAKTTATSADREPPAPAAPVTTVQAVTRPEPRPERVVALPPADTSTDSKSKKKKDEPSGGLKEKGLAFVDGTMAKASKRLGPYLPEWMFTRIMFGVVFIALLLMIILPGLVSTFMLIAGALVVVFGAVVYSDPMLASRWLPGRTQPPHVLLFGVVILMLGVLLGVIAR